MATTFKLPSRDVVKKLCEIAKLDQKMIRKISIEWDAESAMAIVKTEFFLPDQEANLGEPAQDKVLAY